MRKVPTTFPLLCHNRRKVSGSPARPFYQVIDVVKDDHLFKMLFFVSIAGGENQKAGYEFFTSARIFHGGGTELCEAGRQLSV